MSVRDYLIRISKLIQGEIPTKKLIAMGMKIGNNFYRGGGGLLDPSAPYLIEIGDNVTFSRNVTVLAHDASMKQSMGMVKLGKVIIGDNCICRRWCDYITQCRNRQKLYYWCRKRCV